MSRIGNKPIKLPDNLEVKLENQNIHIKGSKGQLSFAIPKEISVEIKDKIVNFVCSQKTKKAKALHGLTRSIVTNMVEGVCEGWKKTLEVIGTGYRVQLQGNLLKLSLGYSHPIEYKIPEGISIKVIDNNKIEISGIDKQQVGQVAANIRKLRQPDSYKGKGIRYLGEHISLKEGKSAKK